MSGVDQARITTKTVKQALDQLLAGFPDHRLREVYDFARFLEAQEERRQWQQFGAAQLARAYGPNDPEFSPATERREAIE
jgi:hypothetical protein